MFLAISLLCNVYFYFKLPSASSSQMIAHNAFDKMTQQVRRQMQTYPQKLHTKTWDYKIAVKDLSVQVGSLTKLSMQLENERDAYRKSDQAIKDEIADELADLLSLALFIAHELKIDIMKAWENMLKADEEKFIKNTR